MMKILPVCSTSKTTLSYTLGQYDLSFQATKGSTNVVAATLKKGEKVLIDAYVDASGNVDNFLSDEDPGNIGGNVLIKINDALAFAGKADITKYLEAKSKAETEYKNSWTGNYTDMPDEEKYIRAKAKAFNDFFELYLVSLSDKTKIARLQVEVKSYNENGYSRIDAMTVLLFGDNTNVEVEVYFGSGFEEFRNKLEDFIKIFED